MPVELSDVCKHCGKEVWQHVQRRSVRGLDIFPCVQWVRSMMKRDYKKRADKDGNCKLCGKPLLNHWEYERISFHIMDKLIVARGDNILFPAREIECGMVPRDEPISHDLPLEPER